MSAPRRETRHEGAGQLAVELEDPGKLDASAVSRQVRSMARDGRSVLLVGAGLGGAGLGEAVGAGTGTGALKRTRAAIHQAAGPDRPGEPPSAPGSTAEKRLIDRLAHLYETGDAAGFVAPFTDDAWLRMPPMPLEYQARDLIARFLSVISSREERTYRLVATRGQWAACVRRLPARTRKPGPPQPTRCSYSP